MFGRVGALAFTAVLLAPTFGAFQDTQRSEASTPRVLRILVLEPDAMPAILARLDAWGIDHHPYPNLHMAAALVPLGREDDVRSLPGVVGLHESRTARPYLSQSAPYVGADIAWSTYRTTGEGVGILVVDTGVDGTHPDVRLGRNLVENVATRRQTSTGLLTGYEEGVESTDLDGHGTHAAGIAGGTGVGDGGSTRGRYRGIAHGADLVGFQAGVRDLQTGDTGFDTPTVLEAFEYAIANRARFNLRVVSNSWGINGEFSVHDPVNLATLEMYRKGLVVVFAAGNEGDQGPGHLNVYSVAPWVLSVAAGDYYNRPASFSSTGTADPRRPWDHPDLMAPGERITSARAAPATGSLANLLPVAGSILRGDLYTAKSGTSMAAPHVAGAAALLLSYDPTLSPDNVYDLLVAAATPAGGVAVEEAGAGSLNILKALQLAATVQGNRDEFLRGDWKYSDRNLSADPLSVGLHGHRGAPADLDRDVGELARDLVGTGQGLVFLLGTATLALLAFRPVRGSAP